MDEKILVVNTHEFEQKVGNRPFLALPQEEVDRLYACIEVMAMDADVAAKENSVRVLVSDTVLHHNYSWLAYDHVAGVSERNELGKRTMIVPGQLFAESGDSLLFLDSSLRNSVRRQLDEVFGLPQGYEMRLVGLLNDGAGNRAPVGLVYVARLRQPGVITTENSPSQIRWSGSGQLSQEHDAYDAKTQILIDHLQAF
jgi:predicted NUDIX family phosphoesterase